MHIIWKRPDGFENAQPEDFFRVTLSNGAQLWLHHIEKDWYPFQVSGDWEGQEETQMLNGLVNLLGKGQSDWERHLTKLSARTFDPNPTLPTNAQELIDWLARLEKDLKGHAWEIDVIRCVMNDIVSRLEPLAPH